MTSNYLSAPEFHGSWKQLLGESNKMIDVKPLKTLTRCFGKVLLYEKSSQKSSRSPKNKESRCFPSLAPLEGTPTQSSSPRSIKRPRTSLKNKCFCFYFFPETLFFPSWGSLSWFHRKNSHCHKWKSRFSSIERQKEFTRRIMKQTGFA